MTTDPPFPDVASIAVLRGGHLGDLLLTLPALDALAAAYPGARLTLLGAPLHAALLADRPSPVAEVVVVPAVPGVRDSAGEEPDPVAAAAFRRDMQGRGFDLAVQLHGGGRHSNPFVRSLGARHAVGAATPDAAPLDRTVRYTDLQHETLRTLDVVALAGATPVALEPVVTTTAGDLERAAAYAAGHTGRPLVALHPGATDRRRRWPPSSFVAVVRALAERDVTVVLVGDESEAPLAESVVAAARGVLASGRHGLVTSLAGRLSIPDLVGLLATADLFVGNDSGPRHLAQAVGTATVSVWWIGNVVTYGPLTRVRHRVHVSWTTRCPECGAPAAGPAGERCGHDPSFVASVAVEDVVADAMDLLGLA